ncbi:MAG: HAMP domain-containing protein [Defluviitaleaceae bacterium]|nr:HAMP domain-containing protein [Defluviitaleaceae bacterium]
MNFISKMKVQKKILLSFAVALTLFSAVFIYIIYNYHRTGNSYDSEIVYAVTTLNLIASARDEYANIGLLSREFFMRLGDGAFFDEAENRLNETIENVLGCIDTIEANAAAHDKLVYKAPGIEVLRSSLAEYRQIFMTLINSGRIGDMNAFQSIFLNIIQTPAHVEFLEAFENMFYAASENLVTASEGYGQNTIRIIVISIISLVVTGIICVLISVLLSKQIKNSLNTLTRSAEMIAAGDLSVDLSNNRTDEFSQLQNTFAEQQMLSGN